MANFVHTLLAFAYSQFGWSLRRILDRQLHHSSLGVPEWSELILPLIALHPLGSQLVAVLF